MPWGQTVMLAGKLADTISDAELEYIHADDAEEAQEAAAAASEKSIPLLQCLRYRQAWAVILGKFISDGVWWFFLFWAPSYFDNQFGAKATTTLGQMLLVTLYSISSILSIFGGYLPKFFVERKGMHAFDARMRSMLIFAFFPMCALAYVLAWIVMKICVPRYMPVK